MYQDIWLGNNINKWVSWKAYFFYCFLWIYWGRSKQVR